MQHSQHPPDKPGPRLRVVDSQPQVFDPKNIKKLPTPSKTVSILLQALVDEDMDFHQLAEILEQFPSIVVRLIALANSAWSSPVSTIDSLEMACARLGFNVVRSVSIAVAISAPFDPSRCPAFNAERFWCSAFLNADAATWLVERHPSINPQAARTAGLLYNLGLLLLVVDMPDKTHQALTEASAHPDIRLNHALQQHCGIGYDEAGAIISQAWRLPDKLANAIGGHRLSLHEIDNELTYYLALACQISSSLCSEQEYIPVETGGCITPPPVEHQLAVLRRLKSSLPKTRQLASLLYHY